MLMLVCVFGFTVCLREMFLLNVWTETDTFFKIGLNKLTTSHKQNTMALSLTVALPGVKC